MEVVYNATATACECQYILGLEPTPVDACAETVCIAEKQPVVDEETGVCGCEYIPGLELGAAEYE